MARRPRGAAALLAVLLALLAAGCERTDTAFRAESAAGSGDALCRNEALVIGFNRRVDDRYPVGSALRITGPLGEDVPFAAAVDPIHRNRIVVRPAAPRGWPAGVLTVAIPFPTLGRPLRADDGTPLTEPFLRTLRVADRYWDAGRDLRLEYASLPPGTTHVPRDAAILLRFSDVIDERSLEEGLVLRRAGENHAVSAAGGARLRPDGVTLEIRPFADPATYAGGTVFELLVTDAIRALSGRSLLRGECLRFTTLPADTDVLTFRIAEDEHGANDLADPAAKPERGPLRPSLAVPEVSRQSDFDFPDILDRPLGRTPSRVQIRIPRDELAADGGLPAGLHGGGLITGIVFLVGPHAPQGIEFPGIVVRLSETDSGAPLRPEFGANVFPGTLRHMTLVQDGADTATFRVRPLPDRTFAMEFRDPFPWSGLRDLLIDIENPFGGWMPDYGIHESVDWRGRRGTGSGSTVEGRPNERSGEPLDFRYALAAVIRRPRAVTTEWRPAPFARTRFSLRPDGIRGTGRLYEDFNIEFEGRTGSATTGWKRQVEELEGAAEIRARIVFDPGARPDDVAIERFSVHCAR